MPTIRGAAALRRPSRPSKTEEPPPSMISRGSVDDGNREVSVRKSSMRPNPDDEGFPKRLSRASINYESKIILEASAEDELPKELKEHKRKKRMFSRLRLKKLEEARYGLYIPLSPRSVQRNGRSKEKIRKIVSMLKISPRVTVRGEEKNKDWKLRPGARESPVVKHLRDRLQERKESMKPYTSNKLFEKILEITEEERVYPKPEDFWRQSISSKFEKMARELIDKTAYFTARLQHGVWSQTGMPYACLGVPSTNRPSTAPLPNLEDRSADQTPFDFFPAGADTQLMAEIAGKEREERHVPMHIARREAILKAAKQTSTVSRLLMKMGLLHLHDMDNARFPLAQVHLTANLMKRVKGGGAWLEDIDKGMMKSAPRELSVAAYTGRTIVGPAGNVEHFRSDSSSSHTHESGDENKEPSAPSPEPHRHSEHIEPLVKLPWLQRPSHKHTEQSFMVCQSDTKQLAEPEEPEERLESIDWKANQSLVFNLKRRNLLVRKKMLYELNLKLTSLADRREHWRGVTNMSAELCKRLEAVLFRTKGRRAPSTKHLWKTAQELHPVPRQNDRPDYESEAYSIRRFYERVCTFIDHQKMADPLMDVLIYLLREMLENGQKLQSDLLLSLCEQLARMPESVANIGRMVCIMPILQFIAKELRITSTEYDSFITKSGVDRVQPSLT
ncbi:hypothetical protein MPTK1_3g03710 [Marchantia polymorpha subsp. ruderalis]|uniref:Uncharacterized protein n=2 Tax=Marchantia polymorpha TaxID=3197 RepID=A0AAF6AX46_MARPO|nr:hypothetical protein MARPO_0022s0161 [Marchantia polymorpha]BBN04330.1 hypothetical protein Mp_3g03710 [Marchantia polymorpha subsp. ruderalis]|eukprot:PTQ44075.1 hypothetical protein MARPO_0022s0161 [Marchantia polymorpha]